MKVVVHWYCAICHRDVGQMADTADVFVPVCPTCAGHDEKGDA